MALLHNPRLSRVVALCVFGVLACGVALALAGPTPQPPTDPLDALPANVRMPKQWTCAPDLINAVTPTVSVTEPPGPTVPQPCWHIALVQSTTETGNQLADRLVGHFTARGFEFTGQRDGEFRALTGVLAQCGTSVTIDTGESAAFLPPGARGNLPPGFTTTNGATVGLPGGGLPGVGGAPPSTPSAGDPTMSTVPTIPTESTQPGASPPSTPGPSVTLDPSLTLPSQPLDPSGLEGGGLLTNPAVLSTYLQPDQQGSAVMIASQQVRAVVPKALEGRC